MNDGVLNRFRDLRIPTSIILMLHLMLIMVQSSEVFPADRTTQAPTDLQIAQQTFFGGNPGWLKVKQYEEGPLGKIAYSCKVPAPHESRAHLSVVSTGFPSEKTPSFQSSILYTLQTSSDL